jgi:excisionase family DNA binding protein
MTDKYYTVEESAALWRVSVPTVRRWIANGRLRVIRLPGGAYRIPIEEIERLHQPYNVES